MHKTPNPALSVTRSDHIIFPTKTEQGRGREKKEKKEKRKEEKREKREKKGVCVCKQINYPSPPAKQPPKTNSSFIIF